MTVTAPTGWSNPATAAAYAEFTRTFPMYRDTSQVVGARAGVGPGDRVLDLCCGTGVTTAVVLDVVGPNGAVVALDGSPEMLAVARSLLVDDRVTWVESDAENLAAAVEGPFDAVVCNSAIWQTDLPVSLAAISGVLREDGKTAFNIGGQFIIGPLPPPATKPCLAELMVAFATIEHDFVQPRFAGRSGGGGPLTVERVTEMLREAGLEPDGPEWVEHPRSIEQDRAWLSIPIFTEMTFAGLSYEQRMDSLERASRRVDPDTATPGRWAYFTARKS